MTGLPNKLAASFSEYADRLAPSPDYKQSILDDLTLTFLSIASASTPKAIVEVRKDTGWYEKSSIWTLGVIENPFSSTGTYSRKALCPPHPEMICRVVEDIEDWTIKTTPSSEFLSQRYLNNKLILRKDKGLTIVVDVFERCFGSMEDGDKISLFLDLFDTKIIHQPIVSFATTASKGTVAKLASEQQALYNRFLYHPVPGAVQKPSGEFYVPGEFQSIVSNAYDRLESLPPCTHKLNEEAKTALQKFCGYIEENYIERERESGDLEIPCQKANIHAVRLAMLIHNLRYIYGEADDQATIEKRDMDDAIVIVCESLQYIADLGNNLP